MLCSKSARPEGRSHIGPVQVACRIWVRCRSLDAGIMALGLVPVVAVAGRDGVDGEDPGPLAGDPGGEPPGPVSARRPGAGRGEGEPGLRAAGRPGSAGRRAGRLVPGAVRRPGPLRCPGASGSAVSSAAAGFGPGAGVPGGASAGVGDGQAPRRRRVRGGGGGQVAGQPRVDRAEAGELPGPVGEAEQGGQRDGEVVPAGEPGRDRPGRRIRGPGRGRPGGPRRPRPGRCRAGERGGSPGPGAGPGRPGRAARPSRPRSRPPGAAGPTR